MEWHIVSNKREKINDSSIKWITLKCILVYKRNRTEKAIYLRILFIWHSGTSKTIEIAKKISSCQALDKGEILLTKMTQKIFG